jgi:serine/threonine protein kinase
VAPQESGRDGETLAHYRILRKLGSGSTGEVYLADDLNLGRQVALKFLPARGSGSIGELERFRREAKAAASAKAIEPEQISIEPYCFDKRTGWDTYLICIEGYGVWGMANGPI